MLYSLSSRNDFQGPGETITGTASGVVSAVTGIGRGLASGPMAISHDIHEHEKHKKRSKRNSKGRFSFGRHKKDKEDEAVAKTEEHQKRDRGNPTANALPENTQQSGKVQEELENGQQHGKDETSASSDESDNGMDDDHRTETAPSDDDFAEHIAKHTAMGLVKPIAAVAEGELDMLLMSKHEIAVR